MYYKLNPDLTVSPVADPREVNHTSIARTYLASDAFVSTVFLGLDHQFTQGGPPLVFETMIFTDGTFADCYQERSSTFEEAIQTHKNGIDYAIQNQLIGTLDRVKKQSKNMEKIKKGISALGEIRTKLDDELTDAYKPSEETAEALGEIERGEVDTHESSKDLFKDLGID